MSEILSVEKPTLGIRPKKFWLTDRFEDLQRVIIDRVEQGLELKAVHKWIDEMIEIQEQINGLEE